MTSRTISPLSVSNSSPGRSPAAAAGEPGATATTRAVGIRAVYEPALRNAARLAWSRARPEGPPRPTARLLRGRGDGDQGPLLDGAGVRAARVLLPRDRAQPAGGRPVPRPRCGVRRRRGRRPRWRAP